MKISLLPTPGLAAALILFAGGCDAGSTPVSPEGTLFGSGPGSYLVRLTVRNGGGEDSASRFVTVPGSGDVCP